MMRRPCVTRSSRAGKRDWRGTVLDGMIKQKEDAMLRNRFAFLLMAAFASCFVFNAAFAENRVALVIGNSSYQNVGVLPNPANDAKAVTRLLTDAGFEILTVRDLTQTDLRRTIRDFAEKVTQMGEDTVVLVFYAGHGLQIDGENYLVPVDAKIQREADVAVEAVRLTDLMNALSAAPARTRIVILDACRNNPFDSISRTTGKGLAIVDAPTGSIVSYSTAPGTEALDGSGDNSPFTAALIKIAREPGLPIEQAFKQMRLAVHKATDGRQTPWESTSLTGDFVFFPGGVPATKPPQAVSGKAGASAGRNKPPGFWRKELQSLKADDAFEIVIREDDVDAYEDFLALFSKSAFAPRVRGLLERRREMMTWYTAVTVNTVLAYQAFLERYPMSDLAATAKRLLERAKENSASPNFVRGLADTRQASAPPLPATPAVVTAPAPPCVCSKPPPRPPSKRVQRPRHPRPPTDEEIFGRRPPPRDLGPAIDIGIGVGGGLRRRHSRPPRHHN
jgi:hypothetical protein